MKKRNNGAYMPADYDPADITAIQQLAQGTAGPEMQKRALKWIIEEACKTYDLSYRPGDTHDTAFAEGKRFVGLGIVTMFNLDPRQVRSKTNAKR